MFQEAYRNKAVDVLHDLRVDRDLGLTSELVRQRRERFGSNELPTDGGRSPWLVFLDRFKDVLILVLLGAAALAWLLGRAADSLIIVFVLFLDASLSFAQVWRTEKTLRKIRDQVQPDALVLRGGSLRKIAAKELVVGDIIEIRAGEKVPADARLFKVQGLRVNEAALTGESDDVIKMTVSQRRRAPISSRRNMVYLGTSIVNGTGRAVVVATGTRTEFGKIAQVLKVGVSPPSPLHRKLQRVGLQIGVAIIVAVGLLFLIGIWQGKDLLETSLTAITLVVSAIPEDLTMILTIALTVGVTRILRRGGAVRTLASGEALGAATVICTDKTGTITRGVMEPERFEFSDGDYLLAGAGMPEVESLPAVKKLALQAMALSSDARKIASQSGKVGYVGTATDRAALVFVEDLGIKQEQLRSDWQRKSSISFSSQWKYRATLQGHPSIPTSYLLVVGAPEVILSKCSERLGLNEDGELLSDKTRFELETKLRNKAGDGFRLLGVAIKRNVPLKEIQHSDITELLYLGFLALRDPVREGVPSTVRETLAAGVKIKLVTGDHPETARAVAREIGLGVGEVVTSSDLETTDDREMRNLVQRTTVFARITPLDKQRIVRALQANGEIVAMTGDGINDAVALKGADIGVAVGSGSEIAKEAADLILLDDSLTTIVAAIREGRVLRDNIRKVLAFLLSTNMAEIAIFFASLALGMPLPLLPAQILWINLVTDGTSDIALSLEPAERGVMKRKPEDPVAQLLGYHLASHIVSVGFIITAAAMGLYWYLLERNAADITYVRTMVFTFVSFVSLLSVWSFRSLRDSILRRGVIGNKWIFLSLLISAALHLVAVYWPPTQRFFSTVALNASDLILVIVIALVTIVVIDARKIIFNFLWKAKSEKPVNSAKGLPVNT